MSTECGRPQGGLGGPAHVDGGVKNVIFCERHKWMAPNPKLLEVKQPKHSIYCCSCPSYVQDFCSICTPSQLDYNEYTDCTLSVGRRNGEGQNWPYTLIRKG